MEIQHLLLLIFAVCFRYAVFDHHTLDNVRDYLVRILPSKFGDLIDCPFCNGYWTGLITYFLYCYENINWFSALIFFPISVGYISMLIEEKRKLDEERYAYIMIKKEEIEEGLTGLILDKHGG